MAAKKKNDVDYTVVMNVNSSTRHLMLQTEETRFIDGVTACGLRASGSNLIYDTKNTRTFWRAKKSCKNCKRAAKH